MDDEAVQAFGLNKEVKLVTKVRAIVRKIRKSELKRNSLLERTEAVLGEFFNLLCNWAGPGNVLGVLKKCEIGKKQTVGTVL